MATRYTSFHLNLELQIRENILQGYMCVRVRVCVCVYVCVYVCV